MGSVFASAPWIETLAATYGFEVKASVLAESSQPAAAILFSEVDDIRGRRVVSLPFSDYCDPFVQDRRSWNCLVDPLLALGAPIRLRVMRNQVPLEDPRFSRTTNALWHAADLSRPEDEMWASLSGSATQNIRKAERNGVVVRQSKTLEDVRTFYEMHRAVRRSKYRLFAQPFSFFENLHATFSRDDRLIVLLAEVSGVAIAGILFLIDRGTLYYKFNASVDLEMRPNDLLVWNGMRLGRERGLARLDFGLSDTSQPGLVRFKRKFATDERPIHELRWSPPGYADPRATQTGQVLHRLTEILTSAGVPDDVTGGVGDELYRFFC